MQMKEAGIMIEGGAMRSVFAAGVLDFLLEKVLNKMSLPLVI